MLYSEGLHVLGLPAVHKETEQIVSLFFCFFFAGIQCVSFQAELALLPAIHLL